MTFNAFFPDTSLVRNVSIKKLPSSLAVDKCFVTVNLIVVPQGSLSCYFAYKLKCHSTAFCLATSEFKCDSDVNKTLI